MFSDAEEIFLDIVTKHFFLFLAARKSFFMQENNSCGKKKCFSRTLLRENLLASENISV